MALAGLLLLVVGRWAHFAGFALSFGVLFFRWAALWPAARRARPSADTRLWGLVNAGIAALLAAEVLTLAALALPAAQSSSLPLPAGRAQGQLLGQRLAVALLLWLLTGAWRSGGRRQARWLSAGSIALGLVLGALDGAAAAPAAATATSASSLSGTARDWWWATMGSVHVLAMAAWTGALVGVIRVWGLAEVAPVRTHLLKRVTALAGACVLALTASGVALAAAHLPAAGLLVEDWYGRTLLLKLACFAAALLLAAAARRRTHSRWWQLEGLCLAAVLGLAAVLVTLPPPS